MVTLKTSLGPRAHRLLRKISKEHKTPISQVLTLLILACDLNGFWDELDELIERKKELVMKLRKKREAARKKGIKLGPGEEPKRGEALIEYFFDQAAEAQRREIEAVPVPAPPPKMSGIATIIPPKSNSFLRRSLADLRGMHQNATEAGDTFAWGPALEAIIYAKECTLTMQETSKASRTR